MGILDKETWARLRRKAGLAVLQGERELRRALEETAPRTLADGREKLRSATPLRVFWKQQPDGTWTRAYTGMHRDWATALRAAGRRPEGLTGVDIEGLRLSGDISRIAISRSRLFGVTFADAELSGSRFSEIDADHLIIHHSRLAGARIEGLRSEDPLVITRSNLASATLHRVNAPLLARRLCLAGARITDCDFSHSRLEEVDFSRTRLDGVNLTGATISTDCVFDGATLRNVKGLETVRVIGPDGRGRPDLRLTERGFEKLVPRVTPGQYRGPRPPIYI